jgi:hypothetical protein
MICGQVLEVYNGSQFLKSKISFEQGYFYFHGQADLIKLRQQRYNLADKKYKIVLKALRVMKLVPSLRSAMICNSLSFNNSSDHSDLDLFLIIEKKTLWVTRLLLIGLSEILGVRIHLEETRDKICLSFFTCVDNYNFSKIAVPGQDVYLQYWLATLAPVFGEKEYRQFFLENSVLLANLPNIIPKRMSSRRSLERQAGRTRGLSPLLTLMSLFNSLTKKFQVSKKAPYKLALAQSDGSEVILNDEMLKFHDNDRRWLYQQQYLKRCSEFIESEGKI